MILTVMLISLHCVTQSYRPESVLRSENDGWVAKKRFSSVGVAKAVTPSAVSFSFEIAPPLSVEQWHDHLKMKPAKWWSDVFSIQII